MLNSYMAERYAKEYRREAEAFAARQRLVAQAERNHARQVPVLAGFIERLARAIHLQAARQGNFRSVLRKV